MLILITSQHIVVKYENKSNLVKKEISTTYVNDRNDNIIIQVIYKAKY